MSEYVIKLAGALPKEAPNGWANRELAEELWHAKIEGRNVQPRVAVLIYDVQDAGINKNGDHVVTVRVLRVQPVDSLSNRRALEQVLLSEYREQTGSHTVPYEIAGITKQAFVDLPKTNDEIDLEEADEQDSMSPTDELRRHLERVHGIADAHTYTAQEADSKHEDEHAGFLPDVLAHEPDWIGWTRVDIEAATAETDGEDGVILTPLADPGDGSDLADGGIVEDDEPQERPLIAGPSFSN